MLKRVFLTSSVSRVAGDIAKKLGGSKGKKLLYVYTAGEHQLDEVWQKVDRQALAKAGFRLIDYTITGQSKEQVKRMLVGTDAIYFGGGNTFYLLEKLQLAGALNLIRDFVARGGIYIGTSAGSIVAGPDISPFYMLDKARLAPKLRGYKGLGLVDFVVLPHWGSPHFKNRYLGSRLRNNYNLKNKLVILNDYQYVEVRDDWYRLVEVRHKK